MNDDVWELIEKAVFFFVGVAICVGILNACSSSSVDDCVRTPDGDFICESDNYY